MILKSNIKDGGSIFPEYETEKIDNGNTAFCTRGTGMTLRDWFAGQALAGILADGLYMIKEDNTRDIAIEALTDTAYELANAMLLRRAK